MVYVEPVNPADIILSAHKELNKCIALYFSEISLEEAANPEILDEQYTEDFLQKIQDDYYMRLEKVWDRNHLYRRGTFSGLYSNPSPEEIGDMKALDKAYRDARRRTLWEKLTKTNHKDVLEYKQLLKQYSEALLESMLARFSDAVAKVR